MNADDHDVPDDDDTDRPSRRVKTVIGHRHECANNCGVILHCPHEDRCRVRDTPSQPWICPSCLDHIDELALDAMADHYAKQSREKR